MLKEDLNGRSGVELTVERELTVTRTNKTSRRLDWRSSAKKKKILKYREIKY